MLNVTRLLCGVSTPGDALRYGEEARPGGPPRQASVHRRPIVVWNTTRSCNLHCIHCYSSSDDADYPGELTTDEAKGLMDQLADYGAPVVLFSGGEPLMRHDLYQVIGYAVMKGLRTVMSTNGTLLNNIALNNLRAVGLSQIGISLDGVGEVNDRFRGRKGAFEDALGGIRRSLAAGFRTSLRLTLTSHNAHQLDEIFDLVEAEGIPRVCIYHLAYAGRGGKLLSADLDHQAARAAMDRIFARTRDFAERGLDIEVLTVDNHTDGVYLYQRLAEEDPERAREVYALLARNGGNSSGRGIASVDNVGNVHGDQFWWHYSFGNVKERPFGEIWEDTSDPLMRGLKDRRGLLKGRCGRCSFVDLCNGNLRIRAETAYGDVWAEDPACYLTEEEISVSSLAAV